MEQETNNQPEPVLDTQTKRRSVLIRHRTFLSSAFLTIGVISIVGFLSLNSNPHPKNTIVKADVIQTDNDIEADIPDDNSVLVAVSSSPKSTNPSNPTQIENQNLGTSDWRLNALGFRSADDKSGQIKGYADKTSANKNETINLKVSVDPAQNFTLDIYRLGWYQGLGGRLMKHIGPITGIKQKGCPPDPITGLIECNWTSSYSLTIPSDWVSGAYVVVARNSNKFSNYINFTVRDDSRNSDILFQNSTNTWQAYNGWPEGGGKSLYAGKSWGADTVSGGPQAVKVSYDRPYMRSGTRVDSWEIQFIRWIEKEGYDVTYQTDVDTSSNSSSLLNHKAFLEVGHDEYWSPTQRSNVQNAINHGVNVGFFGGNDMYWQVRFEKSSSEIANRTIVGYKEAASKDPYYSSTDPAKREQTTTQFRLYPVSNTEQKVLGTMYAKNLGTHDHNLPMTILASSNWVFANTSLSNGDTIPNIYGYEYNKSNSSYPKPKDTISFTVLAKGVDPAGGMANSTIYTAPGGALVFSAGTTDWSWALDSYHTAGLNLVNPKIQQITANILNRFVSIPISPTPTP